MDFLKHKIAVAGAILSVVMSASLLGNSLIYGFSEDYKTWKQYGSSWSTMQMGTSSDTVSQSGCAVTSAAILMVHSGSVSSEGFNPGVIVDYLNQNGGLDSYGVLNWWVLSSYAPDFKYVTDADNILHGTTQAEKAQEIQNFLDSGYYVMVRISNGKSTHFVAVDSVNGSRVTMMDPGSSSTSLFDKYDVSSVTQVRLFRGKYSSETAVSLETAPETAPAAPETTVPETASPVTETTIAEAENTDVIIKDVSPETTTTAAPAATTAATTTTTVATAAATESSSTSAETTTTAAPATTEIIITTKATTAEELVLIEPEEEIQPEIIADPVAEEDLAYDIEVIFQDAPETAPVGDVTYEELSKTKTLYIPEEQAEATLIEIKEQHVLMSIRFTIKTDLNLHAQANQDAEILNVIPANTSLNVVEVDEDFKWGRVLYNGCEGWIALNFAEL